MIDVLYQDDLDERDEVDNVHLATLPEYSTLRLKTPQPKNGASS